MRRNRIFSTMVCMSRDLRRLSSAWTSRTTAFHLGWSGVIGVTHTVFILSYERPLYLWATLDGLYRATKSDLRFVLIDSGSKDPLVHRIIDSFVRRGLLSDVVKYENNDTAWASAFFEEWHNKVGEVFFYIESDVVIKRSKECWAEKMLSVMQSDPLMAMLGSMIDKSDFIDPKAIELRLNRNLTEGEKEYIKLSSPERNLKKVGPDNVVSPFNPPGRLLALRTKAVKEHLENVMQWNDHQMHHILRRNGWKTGIYGGVVHRHLSLCNYFDYPDYSMDLRDQYMELGCGAEDVSSG